MKFYALVFLILIFFTQKNYAGSEWKIIVNCDIKSYTFLSDTGTGMWFSIISDKTGKKIELGAEGGVKGDISEYACIKVDNIPYLLFRGHNAFGMYDSQSGFFELTHIAINLDELDGRKSKNHLHEKQLHNFFMVLDKTKINDEYNLTLWEISNKSEFRRVVASKYPYIENIYKAAEFQKLKFESIDE
jgi:hypothetical protein